MRFRFFSVLLIVIFATSKILFAQKEQNLCEVTVVGLKPTRFMVGQKVQVIDSAVLAQNRFTTLAEFLQFQAPLAFRSYGTGQLSTVSIRGTAAHHTAVLWNGININMPALGLIDFSTLPLSGFDELAVQLGSSASCVGTDAVGGSILLDAKPSFSATKFNTSLGFKYESNRNIQAQGVLRTSFTGKNQLKIACKTTIYGNLNNNDFGPGPFNNKSGSVYLFEPSLNKQTGLVNDIFLMSKTGNLLSFHSWINANELHINPNVNNLLETTATNANRFMINYLHKATTYRVAYIKDYINFIKNQVPSESIINRFSARVEQDFSRIKSCDKGTNLKVGTEINRYLAKIDGYGPIVKTENRIDLYFLLRHQFNKKLSSSFNLRQAFINSFDPPFTPSVGLDYLVFLNENNKINFEANTGLSYRVPTLNERFWKILGNPNILPENAFNKEVALIWKKGKPESNKQWIHEIRVYHNLIKNYAYWNPEKNYRVENIQEVLSKGFEISQNFNKKFNNKATLGYNLQYAFTNASQQKSYGPFTEETINKQLIYIPRHTLAGSFNLKLSNHTFNLQQQLVSKRYITFDHSGPAFMPYALLNFQSTHNNIFNQKGLLASFQIQNLGNTIYPNLKKNAMPTRTFGLSLVYQF